MSGKIPGNAFNFKVIKATFYLKKQNETRERSSKFVWYFHFFWNSNYKEIATAIGKSKKRKIKNQNKQKEKMNQRNKINIHAFNLKRNNFITATHHNRFKLWWVVVTCQPTYSQIFRMLSLINKKMRTAVMVAVATKINDKKVIYDGAFLRKYLTAKSHLKSSII